jgi:hypothetical protein
MGLASFVIGGAAATFSRSGDAGAAALGRAAGLSTGRGAAALDWVSFGADAAAGFSGAAVTACATRSRRSGAASAFATVSSDFDLTCC